jgi:hypothetical protein
MDPLQAAAERSEVARRGIASAWRVKGNDSPRTEAAVLERLP